MLQYVTRFVKCSVFNFVILLDFTGADYRERTGIHDIDKEIIQQVPLRERILNFTAGGLMPPRVPLHHCCINNPERHCNLLLLQ